MTTTERKLYEKKYAREYYAKNKETIMLKLKEYRSRNKDKLNEYQKAYYAKHKEKARVYYQNNMEQKRLEMRQYYQKNRLEILNARKVKITCECGSILSKSSLCQHRATQKHKSELNKIPSTI